MSTADAVADGEQDWDGTDGRLQFSDGVGEPVFVDTINGDDANDGRSAATALRTYAEYLQRWTSAPDAQWGKKSVNVVIVDPARDEESIRATLLRKQALVGALVGEARGTGVVLVDSCEAITPSVDAAEISGVMPVRMNRAMRRAKASQARKQGGKAKRTIVLHDPNARYGR
jgi:hypothetical protein